MKATYEIDFGIHAENMTDARNKAEEFLEEQIQVYEYELEIEPEVVTNMTLTGEHHSFEVPSYRVVARGEL